MFMSYVLPTFNVLFELKYICNVCFAGFAYCFIASIVIFPFAFAFALSSIGKISFATGVAFKGKLAKSPALRFNWASFVTFASPTAVEFNA